MSDTVVSALLAKIAQVEREELNVLIDGYTGWTTTGDSEEVRAECHLCDSWATEGAEESTNREADRHMMEQHPTPALRLCRAHRDIISLYTGALFTQSCHPEYSGNNGYVKAMEETLRVLARGLGVEEPTP
jgi:hypothetical protein